MLQVDQTIRSYRENLFFEKGYVVNRTRISHLPWRSEIRIELLERRAPDELSGKGTKGTSPASSASTASNASRDAAKAKRDRRFERRMARCATRLESILETRVHLTIEVVNDRIPESRVESTMETWTSSSTRLRRESVNKGRVTPKALRSAMRRATHHPCATGLAQRMAWFISEIPMQMDAVVAVKAGRTTVGLQRDRSMAATSSLRCRGIHFSIKGVIDGSRRTRKEELKMGFVSMGSVRYPVSFGQAVSKTDRGTRGIRLSYSFDPRSTDLKDPQGS